MKRTVLLVLIVVALSAGCKQQKQTQWGQGQAGQAPQAPQNQVVTPPPMVMPPAEIQRLDAIAKANPANANAWSALGNALMDAQRFAEAIIAYQRSLDIDPKNVDVRVDMGTCYRAVGQPDRAIEEYKKGMQYNPRHPNAHMNSGVVYAYDLGKKKEAIKAFEKYLEVAPNAPNAPDIRQEVQKLKSM